MPQVLSKPATIREQVSEAEWAARVDLAACYRLVDLYGMSDIINNHITMRVPGEPEHFLINSHGELYSEVTASSLYKIHHDGEVILKPHNDYGINRAGYVIHSAIHEARPDVNCIVHTHTRAGMAVAALDCGILPISVTALRFYGRYGIHEYEGVTIYDGEKPRLVQSLGDHDLLLLRNHGLLSCGRSIAEAFNIIYNAEQACQIQVDAMGTGAALVYPEERIRREVAELFVPGVRRTFGELEWPALLRRLDAIDSSYRL